MAEEPKELDPWAIRSNTNYGATSLISNIQEQSKQRAMRQAAMGSILNSIQRSSIPSFMPTGPGPNRSPRNKRGPGKSPDNIKVPRNDKLAALMHAIGIQESGGGNYQAVNPSSGAAGKYQILPGNFVGAGGWDKEALGRDIRLRFYMRHPRAQERIAKYKLGQYLKSYGVRGAAQAWYGGPGAVGDNNISGGSGYPTTGGYADSIMAMVRKYLRRHR